MSEAGRVFVDRNMEIVNLARQGFAGTRIAEMMGITRQRVSQIVLRYTEEHRLAQRARRENKPPKPVRDVEAEFLTRYYSKVSQPDNRGCMNWQGTIMQSKRAGGGGYGVTSIPLEVRQKYGFRRCDYAHRVAYAMWNGSIPAGMTVDHICFNRACCNPGHLQLLTLSQNAARKKRLVLNEKPPAPDTSAGTTTTPEDSRHEMQVKSTASSPDNTTHGGK